MAFIAARGPGPPLFDAEIRQQIALESSFRDARYFAYLSRERQFSPKSLPLCAEEVNQPWCNQLLKRPTSRKPSTRPEGLFPSPFATRSLRCRHIRKIYIAADGVLIPPKHGVDRCAELDRISFVNTARIYPEVLQSISFSLVPAELYLSPPSFANSLAPVRIDFHVLEDDLILFPRVREYCVGRYGIAGGFAQDDGAVRFALQEAYEGHGWGAISRRATCAALLACRHEVFQYGGRRRRTYNEVVVWCGGGCCRRCHEAVSWRRLLASEETIMPQQKASHRIPKSVPNRSFLTCGILFQNSHSSCKG